MTVYNYTKGFDMKKTLALLSVSALALMGCDSQNANAQTQVSSDVGNPDSANILVVEEGYEVISPAPAAPVNQNNDMKPLPGDPGVDVAPADIPAPAAVNNSGQLPAGQTVAPMQNNPNNGTVDETVTETTSPTVSTYEVDESIN